MRKFIFVTFSAVVLFVSPAFAGVAIESRSSACHPQATLTTVHSRETQRIRIRHRAKRIWPASRSRVRISICTQRYCY
jgi:hypothetical protein